MNVENKNSNRKGIIRNRILLIAMFLLILCIICGYCSKRTEVIEDCFVKYEGATTLVEIRLSDTGLIGKLTCGFVDDEVYQKYINGEYEGKIQVYHPYKEGESVIVDTKKISTITVYTYNSFYKKYPAY